MPTYPVSSSVCLCCRPASLAPSVVTTALRLAAMSSTAATAWRTHRRRSLCGSAVSAQLSKHSLADGGLLPAGRCSQRCLLALTGQLSTDAGWHVLQPFLTWIPACCSCGHYDCTLPKQASMYSLSTARCRRSSSALAEVQQQNLHCC
jgi:hypothetical protein